MQATRCRICTHRRIIQTEIQASRCHPSTMPTASTDPIRGTSQLRKGRASIPGQIYHVIAKTHQQRRLLAELTTGRIVVNCLRHENELNRARTLSFVVMPDHLHWLLQLGDESALSRVVHNVKSNSARQINSTRKRYCAVWQRGFYDRAIRSEDDLPAIARYIVANPMRAGIARSCCEYPHWDSIFL